MVRQLVTSLLLGASVAAFGVTPAAATEAVETRQFKGEGSSSFGLAYYYAYQDALGQAEAAGFGDCQVVDTFTWPSGTSVWVWLECTRVTGDDPALTTG